MEVGPVNAAQFTHSGTPDSAAPENLSMRRQVVNAIRSLNKSGFVGKERELVYARDPETRRMVIRIMARDTGEVIDQLPPEQVLRMSAELEHQIRGLMK